MLPVDNYQEAYHYIDTKEHLKGKFVFIFVGRLNNLKNIFFIVDALKIVKEKEPSIDFKMLFVGTGQDEEELKKRIKRNNLEKEITLCGKITDRVLLSKYYVRADLFLFPSLYDASSIVQIEAASQKTPVLFLKGAATTSTVTDNVNGFIEENDVSRYANRIIKIVKDKKLLNEVSENAYRDLYKNWDDKIKEVYENYLKFLKNE